MMDGNIGHPRRMMRNPRSQGFLGRRANEGLGGSDPQPLGRERIPCLVLSRAPCLYAGLIDGKSLTHSVCYTSVNA